jgi:hypothetical protein
MSASIPSLSGDRRRFAAGYLAPVLVLLLAVALPLVTGQRTLFLRDVLNTHYEMVLVEAEGLREGRVPLVDPHRSGGQAHLGNPNTSALYPDNLLLLFASPLWVLNARFWLHWLLAPFAFAWLARAWGLSREPAFAGGVCYAASGFFLSHLNLHNLIAGVTLAPALAAAVLSLASTRRPGRHFTALGVLWMLLLLAGDPMIAALALLAAVGALFARHGPRVPRAGWLIAAWGFGTLAAAPQLVEFLRILPATFRGHWGYSQWVASAASLHPAAAVEWVLPLFFGAPDLAFWGGRFFTGGSPLYYSLFPGVLALALVAASGRERLRAVYWAWALVAIGLFLAFGTHNPVARAVLGLAGGLARLPVKFWWLGALGGSLLCAIGFERLLAGRGRRPFAFVLAVLAALHATWLFVAARRGVGSDLVEALLPLEASPAMVEQERLRWIEMAALSLALTLAVAGVSWVLQRRPRAGGALLALHLAGQLFLLHPLRPTDDAAFYARRPAALEALPAGVRVVQGESDGLFGADALRAGDYPDPRLFRLQRRLFETLSPFALVRHGYHAELTSSPEGLDAFVTRAATQAVAQLDDPRRLRLLAASGVEYLILSRPLSPAAEGSADLVWRESVAGAPLHVYRVVDSVAAVRFAGTVRRAPYLNDALVRLVDPGFDRRVETVIAGQGSISTGSVGEVVSATARAERLTARVEATGPGALVWQRAPLPIYRAWVDGEPAPIVVADLHRLAVELPAGVHEVEIAVDRRPFVRACIAALLGLAALPAIPLWLRRRAARRRQTG